MNRVNHSSKTTTTAKPILRILAILAILVQTIAFTACSGDDGKDDGDEGGNSKTVTIGSQVWMAKNLNIEVPGSECYDKKPENCAKYGRLYDWETANTVCPTGFSLPSKEDWDALAAFVKSDNDCSSACDAKHFKAKDDWSSSGSGLDSYGFAALPGGYGYSHTSFANAGDTGYWWSASEYNSSSIYNGVSAYSRLMYDDREFAGWSTYGKTYLFSVRCIKD